MLGHFVREELTACIAFGEQGTEQGGLTAGAGAQVQPAAIVAGDRCCCGHQCDQLAALVLDPGTCLAHGRDGMRVPGGEHAGGAGPAAGSGAVNLVAFDQARPQHQVDIRRFVVRLQQLRQVAGTGGSLGQRLAEGPHDPGRV